MQHLYPKVTWRRGDASVRPTNDKRVIYLTFDDGPIPEVTPRILDILREKKVKATFFVVGDNVRKHPELLQSILNEGHRVGNHTFHHLPGWQTSLAEYLRDVSACDEQLAAAMNTQQLTRSDHPLFRPPYGRMRANQLRELRNAGYEIILWDVLTHDYNPRFSTEKLLNIVRRYSRNGSIVVFHDSLKSNERMLAALPQAIDWWYDNGFVLCTL